jgi:phosphate transport system protein
MSGTHIVKSYEDELKKLDNLVVEMGGLAELQLSEATKALVSRNRAAAEEIASRDTQVDQFERDIDDLALRIMVLRQPLADDLRMVICALKTASDLERIGDYVRNIANRTTVLTQVQSVGDTSHMIERMAKIVQTMIKNVLDAYISRNANLADQVRNRDQEVDQLHNSLFRELLTYMAEDHRAISACTHMLFIAKNIERIGDHVTDIAEHIHMMVTGETIEPGRPKDDHTSTAVIDLV